MTACSIRIFRGILAADDPDEAARKRRQELREKLLRGQAVTVRPNTGEVATKEEERSSDAGIQIPEGKLASSFFWYENDPVLYQAEMDAMSRYFPQFQLEKLSDGRLAWHGRVTPVPQGIDWHLQAIYENNHPHNNTYGGSIKVYSISPDIDELAAELGESIPHVLPDSKGNHYICTSEKKDFKASAEHSTTAASALGWATKWCLACELWMLNALPKAEFAGHNTI
jgi:hypothetical protein